MKPFPYALSEPPHAVKKARLDNIALVPASLLFQKDTYQPFANNLPMGSVLCIPQTQRQKTILSHVATYFKDRGHQVLTLPIERIVKRLKKTPPAETLHFSF